MLFLFVLQIFFFVIHLDPFQLQITTSVRERVLLATWQQMFIGLYFLKRTTGRQILIHNIRME